MSEQYDHDEFARRISRPLRAPERVDDGLELRVMAGVHEAVRQTRARTRDQRWSWWRRPRAIFLSPAALLAMAAGFTMIVAGTSALVAKSGTPQAVAIADTVHLVRFVFADSAAQSIAVVGSFNQWQASATPMHRGIAPGTWTVTVPLGPGRHEYAFVIDDGSSVRWVADPSALSVRDDFGTETSVISLQMASRGSTPGA